MWFVTSHEADVRFSTSVRPFLDAPGNSINKRNSLPTCANAAGFLALGLNHTSPAEAILFPERAKRPPVAELFLDLILALSGAGMSVVVPRQEILAPVVVVAATARSRVSLALPVPHVLGTVEVSPLIKEPVSTHMFISPVRNLTRPALVHIHKLPLIAPRQSHLLSQLFGAERLAINRL